MDELFTNDAFVDNTHGDRGTTGESQTKIVEDNTRQPEGQVLEERDDDAPVQQ